MERQFTKEAGEKTGGATPEWQGGFLEIGGSIYFNTARPSSPYSWPVVRFCEESVQEMKRIRTAFGVEDLSIVSSRSGKPNTLTIQRVRAVDIVLNVRQYTPSREQVAKYVEWWNNSSTVAERHQVAVAYKASKKPHPAIKKERYSALVRSPEFVAGLVDSRGSPFENGRDLRAGMRMYSLNYNLLDALHEHFLGSSPIWSNGTHTWSIEGRDYFRLLDAVEHCLRVYPARVGYLGT